MSTTFDPRGMTWDYWCASMAQQFASNQLGTVPEENWQDWAQNLVGIMSISQNQGSVY